MPESDADARISVTSFDVEELTLAYLANFLAHHGWPDTVRVSPGDFVRLECLLWPLRNSSLGGNPHETYLWLLGTCWVRGAGATTELNWECWSLRTMERR